MGNGASVDVGRSQDLYLQVKGSVLDHVRDNGYGPDDRLPTNRKFATMFKVSPLTVQRALAELAEEGVVYARRGRGTFVRDRGAAPRPRVRSQLYGCVVPTIETNTVAATVYALDDLVFDSTGEHLVVCNGQMDGDREIRLLDSLLDRGVDALIYQPYLALKGRPRFVAEIDERLQRFLAAGVPVVLLDEFPRPDRYDTIIPDDVESCELAVRHLADLDHRRLLFVGHGDLFRVKIETFRRITRTMGFAADDARVAVHSTDAEIARTVPQLLAAALDAGPPLPAIIAATDQYAICCMRHLESLGIRCPGDVSIIGSDNLERVRHLERAPTTIWCEPAEVAEQVRGLIAARMSTGGDLRRAGARRILMPPKLLERKTTAPPSREHSHGPIS